jgi:acetylornithine deacetylase/succinyl-diaminopimelate desuccinylase-like protein
MTDASWPSEAIDLTVEMIRNACVNTGDPASGNEAASVATIQRFLGEPGTVIEPLPGRASVVYRIPGAVSGAPSLLMIPHLDVVPASDDGWTHPPFEGVRSDGFIWGRGAVDMLNVTGAMVAVYRALRDGDLPHPAGDVVLAAVADEEAGGALGARHLVEEYWDLIACDLVLTEVAGPTLVDGAARALPVTVAEKGPSWRRFTSHGIAGHGSQPYARSNAVLTLSETFHRIGTAPQPVSITDEWRRFVTYLPVDEATAGALCDPETVDAAIDAVAEDDPTLARWIHACTHLTFSPNVVAGGEKANVVPASATGEVDIRVLPGQEAADIDDHLRKVLGPVLFDRLDIAPVHEMMANGSEPHGVLWEAIADAAEEYLGVRTLAPTLTPVTTDARFFREKGIPSFGVGLFDNEVTFPEMLAMFHGTDERVSEASVRLTASFLGSTIGHLSRRVREGA